MKSLKFLLLLLTVFTSANSYAEKFEIQILNGLTREKKTYIGGAHKFDIPIANVKGWSKCVAMPIKKFKVDSKDVLRGEVYCSTTNGNSVGFSCASQKNDVVVNINNLFSPNLKFTDADTISVDGFAELTLICNNF